MAIRIGAVKQEEGYNLTYCAQSTQMVLESIQTNLKLKLTVAFFFLIECGILPLVD